MNYQNYLSHHSKTSNIWKWKDVIKITESSSIHYIGISKGTVTKYILKKTTISIIDQYVSLGCFKHVENLGKK